MRRWRLVMMLALVGSLASVVPAEAFEFGTMTRSVGADVVATGAAYSAFSLSTCMGDSVSASTCSANVVTNKGTDALTYQLTLEEDPNNKVRNWGMAGGTRTNTGWSTPTGSIAVGSSATMDIRLEPCSVSCAEQKTFTTYWSVKGNKAGSLDFTVTRIMVVVQYP
ncbi:MAG TPA: hypothetical protein VFH78_02420 [Candidatus Thermoplasmatota archaeon]|nr:hypothetical protein [Candidatus Thermoplasmatota archaeon]